MIQKCLIQREMAKKNPAADGGFRSSLINIIKATAIPKLTAVTHFSLSSCVSFNGFKKWHIRPLPPFKVIFS